MLHIRGLHAVNARSTPHERQAVRGLQVLRPTTARHRKLRIGVTGVHFQALHGTEAAVVGA